MKTYLWLSTVLVHLACLVLSAPTLSLPLVPSTITDGTLLPSIVADALGAEKGPVRLLNTSEIDDQIPFGWFAQAAWCSPASLKGWQCSSCKAESVDDFQLYASGGDGDFVQFWYVGWWPSRQTIVVAHQGTDFNKTFPVLTDAMLVQAPLNQTLFPGIPAEAKAHLGFQLAHQHTAEVILRAVRELIAENEAQKIVTTGHSLGGALAFLDALYLRLNLPLDISVAMRTFGQPRIGNRVLAAFFDDILKDVIRITNQRDLVVQVLPILLGYRHTHGEQHHNEAGLWHACSGRDNGDKNCSLGEVSQRGVSWSEHFGTYAGGIALGAGSCV